MKIFVIDLDGTLLNSNHEISEPNALAIKNRQVNGDRIIIATGRALFDAKYLLNKYEIKDCSIIASNGAEIEYSKQIKQTQDRQSISFQTSQKIFKYLYEKNVYVQVYLKDKILLQQGSEERLLEQAFTQKNIDATFEYQTFETSINAQLSQFGVVTVEQISLQDLKDVIKFMILSPDTKMLEYIKNNFQSYDSCEVSSSGHYNIEVMLSGTSKGRALQTLIAAQGMNMEDTVAIGDNQNDLSLFQVAKFGIAMSNAESSIKRIATYETLHHDEDGVANALNDFPRRLSQMKSSQINDL